MNRKQIFYIILISSVILFRQISLGQDSTKITSPKGITPETTTITKDVLITGMWYIGYAARDLNGLKENEFFLRRGYLTFKTKITDQLVARLTQDITIDREGDGIGDVELRIKYAYLNYQHYDIWIFTKPNVEFGIVHRPWLVFEQHVNDYRVQGQLFLERIGLLSSADFGVTFSTLLGGEMDKDYQTSVNKAFPGKYGSISFGIYNGGGYNELENNVNKNFEGRFSIRPLPFVIPGLQFSYLNAFGSGNTPEAPEYLLHSGMLSYESWLLALTWTIFTGVGNQSGKAVDENGNSVDHSGYSAFLEFRIPYTRLRLVSRYDYLKIQFPKPVESRTLITGIAYAFTNGSKILIDYDLHDETDDPRTPAKQAELMVEVRF